MFRLKQKNKAIAVSSSQVQVRAGIAQGSEGCDEARVLVTAVMSELQGASATGCGRNSFECASPAFEDPRLFADVEALLHTATDVW